MIGARESTQYNIMSLDPIIACKYLLSNLVRQLDISARTI